MNKQIVNSNGLELKLTVRDDADQSVIGEIFKYHEYRSVESIIRSAKDSIVDIGAHAGFFTLYARSLNPLVQIIAVEPELNNIKMLKNHLADNNISKVTVVEGGIAGETGRRELRIARDSHNHSLNELSASHDENSQVVNTWSLPDMFKKCIISTASLVKIDIEGGEYEIFDMLDREFFVKIKSFIIEYHETTGRKREEIENILRENGFGVSIFPSKFDKKMGFIFGVNKRIKS